MPAGLEKGRGRKDGAGWSLLPPRGDVAREGRKGSHKIVNSFDQMKAAMESIFAVLPAIRVCQDLVAETPWTALTHLATPWLLKHCRYRWEQHCYLCLHTSKPAIAQKCHFEQSLVCLEGSSMLYFFVSQSTISKASMFLCRDKLFKFFFVP